MPQGPSPIRVLSTSHEVGFPDQVVLRLEAQAESPITGVTLFYRLADQEVTLYGYPLFVPDTRVSADFTIKTGGAHFLPGGIDIRYRFLIGDADGNTVSSEEQSLEYLDPRYDWQKVREDGLELLSHDVPELRVRQVVQDVGQRLEEARQLLGLEHKPPIRGVIVNNRREAARSFPRVSEASGHLYAGFAFREYGVFALVGLNRDGIIHEATHLLVGRRSTRRWPRFRLG